MEWIALAVRILLAIVFATAAVGKLLDQPGSRRALAEFGAPRMMLGPIGLLLPLAELGTAIALGVHQSARWGAVAALALLLVFMTGIVNAMRRGRAPDCHCFGQLSSSPAGRGTLIRNGLLAVGAAIVAAYGRGKAVDVSISSRLAGDLAVVAGATLAAVAAFVVQLWLENRDLRRSAERAREAEAGLPAGLPIGAAAPRFTLPRAAGEPTSLDALLARGKPVALVFISPGCFPCLDMLPEIARWQTALSERLTIALIASGSTRDNERLAEEHGVVDVLVQNEAEVFEAYRAKATPSAVILTADGRIASRTNSTRPLVETLIRRALQPDTLSEREPSQAGNGQPFEVRQWWSGPVAG